MWADQEIVAHLTTLEASIRRLEEMSHHAQCRDVMARHLGELSEIRLALSIIYNRAEARAEAVL